MNKSMSHEVYLLRHGETEWNLEGRIQGQLDSALTERGREHAIEQGRKLRRVREDIGPHQVICSPLPRAQATARLALGGDDFKTDARIAEIGCGRWENTTQAERLQSDPDLAASLNADFDLYINAPEGEGLDGLTARLTEFLECLNGPTIIFSHKIALVVMRSLLTGGVDELSSNMAPPQGCIIGIKDQKVQSLV